MNCTGSAVEHHPVILAIESATTCGSIAVVGNSRCLGEHTFCAKITHSRRLPAMIKNLMEEVDLGWDGLDGIAVSLGPGSFTGLRIGLATAKGLALATNLPLLGIPTLDGLAVQLWRGRHTLCPVLDARKKEIYTALYRWNVSGELERRTDYLVTSPRKLIDIIEEPVLFTGDGALLYENLFREALGQNAFFAPASMFFPRAAAIGSLAVNMFKQEGRLTQTLLPMTPLYVRSSEAEMEKKKGTT